jgi:hypothetical protein
MPPVYLRTQQISWLEITAGDQAFAATLKSARIELAGATRVERFMAAARNPHASAPCAVASWPDGPGWPADRRHLRDRKRLHRHGRKQEPPAGLRERSDAEDRAA